MDWFHRQQELNKGCATAAPVDINQINPTYMNIGLWLFLWICTHRILLAAEAARLDSLNQLQVFKHEEPITVATMSQR